MSHDKQHHQHQHPRAIPSTEYGPAISTSSSYHYETSEYELSSSATRVIATAPGARSPDMNDTFAHSAQLSQLEKWAASTNESSMHALAGAVGGFTSGIVTCPLDVIKTKLQAQGGFAAQGAGSGAQRTVYKGLVGTARTIWREEGIRGMYRGLGPIILGYLPTWAVWFTVYHNSKDWLRHYHVENTFVINFWSSIIAGASSTIVTNPIWVIKTRLMSQSSHHSRSGFSFYPKGANTPTSRPTLHQPWHYSSTVDAARKMYTTEGIMSFYSGLTPALLGLTHVAVQFPAYEYLKTKFTGTAMGEHPTTGSENIHWFGVLSASILSKILASSATYPHEVIRTRLQTQRRPQPGQEYLQGMGVTPNQQQQGGNGQKSAGGQQAQQQRPPMKYKGIIMTFRTILHEEGWRAFYAGMGTNMMRAVPAATVTMLTYEYVMRQLNQARTEGRHKLDAARGDPAFS